MQEIARSFGKSRVARRYILIVDGVKRLLDDAGHIADAATYLHGVGRNDGAVVVGHICKLHNWQGLLALGQGEVAR